MGSWMPDLRSIPRMDRTLHPCLIKLIGKFKRPTSQQVLERNNDAFKKQQKTNKVKMTAMPKSIDSQHPSTNFIEQSRDFKES